MEEKYTVVFEKIVTVEAENREEAIVKALDIVNGADFDKSFERGNVAYVK